MMTNGSQIDWPVITIIYASPLCRIDITKTNVQMTLFKRFGLILWRSIVTRLGQHSGTAN